MLQYHRRLPAIVHILAIDTSTGLPITSGSPTSNIVRQNSGDTSVAGASTNSPVHTSNGVWAVELTAAERAFDVATVILGFSGPQTFYETVYSITKQARVNQPAGRIYRLKISSTADGTFKATPPVKLRPGTVDIAVAVDMTPQFGDVDVETVGDPTVSAGSVTAEALGPYNTETKHEAMVQLAGTATASEEREVEFNVTMANGDSLPVTFDIKGFSS